MHQSIWIIALTLMTSCSLKQNRSSLNTLESTDLNQHYYCQQESKDFKNKVALDMWFDNNHRLRKFKTDQKFLKNKRTVKDIDETTPTEQQDNDYFEVDTSIPPSEIHAEMNDTFLIEKLFSNDIENRSIILSYRIPSTDRVCKQARVIKLDNWRNQYQPSRTVLLMMEGCLPKQETVIMDGESVTHSVSQAQRIHYHCQVSQSRVIPEPTDNFTKLKNVKLSDIDSEVLLKTTKEIIYNVTNKESDEVANAIVNDFQSSKKVSDSKVIYENEDFLQVLQSFKFQLTQTMLEYGDFFYDDPTERSESIMEMKTAEMFCNLHYDKTANTNNLQNDPMLSSCQLDHSVFD